MNRLPIAFGSLFGAGMIAGCGPTAIDPPPPQSPPVVSRPVERERERERVPSPTTRRTSPDKVTWDSERDRPFADFLRDNSGGMIKEAAVGIERAGMLRVELDRSVAPDDTLELTKSLMAGARKDFPDKPITLAVYDPDGQLVLRARYKVGQGVNYQLANESKTSSSRAGDEGPKASSAPVSTPSTGSTRSGVTEADRKFAEWAEGHGKAYLRYVEADLERHGRLWFGVTREVKPADVPALTRSLLEGAHKEFPGGELVASVFDPEGNKIGKAYLGKNGSVRWEQ